MKKKYLLFAAFAGIVSLTLSSYSSGPISGGLGNRSGSASSQANCTGGGCHGANSASTIVNVIVRDPASPTTIVTGYVPGRTYTVTFGAANTSAALSRFGFQLSAVRAAATSTQAGTFATNGTPNIDVKTTGGLSIVEHTDPIAGNGSGAYAVSFNWTAPASGTGTVRFFGVANVVNNNGAVSGDVPNAGTLDLPEITTSSVANIKQSLAVTAYPSPATDMLQLELGDAGTKTYTAAIFDMTGRKVQQAQLSGSKTSLDVSALVSGQYIISVSNDQAQGSVRFVK